MKNQQLGKIAVPVGVIAIIVMMVVPLPTFLLDLLIAVNITGALLVLLVSMFVTRALEKGVEVAQEIPAEFYGAVAKVLAFVMSLKSRGSAAGVHRNPNPTPAAA